MPRVARFRTAAIDDLYTQLRFAPAATQRRQMDAAERLVRELDPARNYPAEFVVYRVTGYRSEAENLGVTLVGEALLIDLIGFIQRLSDRLAIPADTNGRRGRPLEDVARSLGVSLKTIQRYRRDGLVCHYLVFPGLGKRLACFDDAMDAFVSRHRRRVEDAGRFARIDPAVRGCMIDEARAMHDADGATLNTVARRIAAAHRRAHETVRQILRRHDARAAAPIFADTPPLREQDAHVIFRSWKFGIAPSRLASRYGRSRPTIHRAISQRRAELLRGLDLAHHHLPTFDLEDADAVILASPAACRGLDEILPHDDAGRLLAAVHAAGDPAPPLEDALLAAYNNLKRRAAAAIARLGPHPAAGVLDAIETDLRWATLLKRRLVSLSLPAAIRAIEVNIRRPLIEAGSDELVRLLRRAVETTARAVDACDPGRVPRGPRLVRSVGFAMNRALAQKDGPDLARLGGRAAARHAPGSLPLRTVFGELHPWQRWLDLRPDLAPLLTLLPPRDRLAVAARYGLSGDPPRSLAALARERGGSPSAAARRLWNAEARLRAIARGGTVTAPARPELR